MDEYGNGRQSVINEINHWIDTEMGKIQFESRQIPIDTKNTQLTHKRATLSGNVIALSRIKQLLRKKIMRMDKNI